MRSALHRWAWLVEGLDVVLQSAFAGEVARALCAVEHLDLAVHA